MNRLSPVEPDPLTCDSVEYYLSVLEYRESCYDVSDSSEASQREGVLESNTLGETA